MPKYIPTTIPNPETNPTGFITALNDNLTALDYRARSVPGAIHTTSIRVPE